MDQTISVSYQAKLFKIMLAFPENKHCADCQSLNPDWASTTLGVFICYKCSGIHRSFGIQITRVKSTTLDTWTLKQMYVMGFVDNKQSNDYWEYNLPQGFEKPTCDSAVNDIIAFARKKYIDRAFIKPNTETPAEKVRNGLIFYDGENDDNREAFIRTKIDELKNILRHKIVSMPDKFKIQEIHGTHHKKQSSRKGVAITMMGIPGRYSEVKRSFYEPPLITSESLQAIVSPGGPLVARENRVPSYIDFHSLQMQREEESIRPKPNNRRQFLRSSTQELLPTFGRGDKMMETITEDQHSIYDNSPLHRKIIDYLDEDNIFADNKGSAAKHGEEIELHEISNMTNEMDHKEPLLLDSRVLPEDYHDEMNISISLKSEKSKKSKKSHRVDTAHYELHLKRPGEAFEVSKKISQKGTTSNRKKSGGLCRFPVLLGSLLLHLVMGYMYSWGSISPYIASFTMDDYKDDRYVEHNSHNMMISIGVGLGFCICENASNSIGMRSLVLLSFMGLGGSMLLCSLSDNILLYSAGLTIVAGFFIGLAYEIPFYCLSQYYWKHQNVIKALFYFVNGLGAFGYTYFSYYYLDQESTTGELDVPPKDSSKFYSQELVSHIPDLLSTFGSAIVIIGVVGSLLMHPRSPLIIKDYLGLKEHEANLLVQSVQSSARDRQRRKGSRARNQGLKEALIAPSTKNLLYLTILECMLGTYLLCSYKYIGIAHNFSDAFMSVFGGVGLIVLCIGKMTGVILHPKSEFKTVCKSMIAYQIIAGSGLFLLGQLFDVIFLTFFPIVMFLDGFILSLIIQETRYMYQEDIEGCMTGLIIGGYAVANFLSFMIVKPLILFGLQSLIFFALTIPLFFAYKVCDEYSRDATGDDSEVIFMLLDV